MLDNEDKQWITGLLDTGTDQLIERMRDMQTELLKAFLPFREQVTLREAALEQRQNAIEARQGVLDRRLGEIEKKLLLPGVNNGGET